MSIPTAARRQFIEDYRRIRYAEGRGSADSAYYCALPFADLTGRNAAMWAMRARTYLYFERHILHPLERTAKRPLRILDLGAGNCWLSYRLSLRGHRPFAIDIFADRRDGLGAAQNYPMTFPVVEADFSDLPFANASFDMAVFNSSFHYSVDYDATLAAVRRCLLPDGLLVILDSPVYRKREHGELMAAERHARFAREHGTRSDAVNSIEFLDRPGLSALARSHYLHWTIFKPWYGWRWQLRPVWAWIKRSRPPSRFWILTGRFQS
jgi:SAM-dependent methyltransferase